MAVASPVFLGNAVCVYDAPLVALECSDTPCRARLQTQDWSKAKAGIDEALPPLPPTAFAVDGGSVFALAWALVRTGWLNTMLTVPHRQPGDRRIEDLLGPSPTVIGVQPYEHVMMR